MTDMLGDAREMAAKSAWPFPNESGAYRAARTALLAEEIELRRHIERVAEMRRALPPGEKPGDTVPIGGVASAGEAILR